MSRVDRMCTRMRLAMLVGYDEQTKRMLAVSLEKEHAAPMLCDVHRAAWAELAGNTNRRYGVDILRVQSMHSERNKIAHYCKFPFL